MNISKTRYIKNSIITIGAIAATYMLPYILKLNDVSRFFRSSILMIPVFVGIWLVMHKAWEVAKQDKRATTWAIVAGICGSAMLTLGNNMYLYDGAGLENWYTYAVLMCETPLLTALFVFVFYYYDIVIDKLWTCKASLKLSRLFIGNKRFFLVMWLILFLSWIPGFLSAFPGIYGYDSIFQVKWFMEGIKNSAHPIIHTYFLGGCLKLGDMFFSSYEAGLFIYSMVQMLVLSAIFAYSLKVLCKHLPGILELAAILFYGWMPYNVLFSFSSTKDTLFAGLFLIAVLRTYEIVKEPEVFFNSWKQQICYVGNLFFMFAFRYNGYYAFLCMVLFFLFYNRKYWKKALLLMAATVLLWNVYMGPVHRMLGYGEGTNTALLCIPTQQLARTLIMAPEVFTPEEEKLAKEYLTTWENYSPRVADFVKEGLNEDKYNENPSKFIKLWLNVGLKAPGAYLNAALSQTMGYWYPDMQYPDLATFHPYMEYENMTWADGEWIFIERTSYIPGFSKVFDGFAYGTEFQNIPLFALLCSPGFVFWVMCVVACRCIIIKNYRMLLPCSILFGLWLSIMVSSLVLFRYAYPLMLCIPVLICMGGKNKREKGIQT